MTDILDQAEVDALLTAIDEGEINPSDDAGRVVERSIDIYDFKRPERVSKEQIRILETLHDGFARTLGSALSSFIRNIIEVNIISVEQLTYTEFILSLPNPTCINLIAMKPLEGQIILEMSPQIVFPILDRILGGKSEKTTVPERPLTDIEQHLVEQITERALDSLREMWAQIQPVELEILEVESNPQMVQIVAPNEVVILITFEMTMGGASGMMNLCIPFPVIDPVIDKLTAQTWFVPRRDSHYAYQDDILFSLSDAVLDCVCYLGQTSMTLEDLIQLEVGDILNLEKQTNSSLLVTVEDLPKFRGKPGVYRGKKAVTILDTAGTKDRP